MIRRGSCERSPARMCVLPHPRPRPPGVRAPCTWLPVRAYRLPEDDHRSLVASAQTFLECTTALILFYRSIGTPCFHFTIKYHQLQHLCLQAQYTNPMMGSCYQGEELMQTVRRLLQVSANGASLLTAQSTALQKYSQGLSMMYSL